MKKRIILGLVLVLSWLITASASEDDLGVWTSKTPMLSKRSEVGVTEAGGKIYVVGGFSGQREVEEYDPDGDVWKSRAAMPVALHHVGAASLNGVVYVIGGFRDGWTPVDTVWHYDPTTDKWTARAKMPTPRGALTIVVVDGKVYAIGGQGRGGDLTSNEVFEIKIP